MRRTLLYLAMLLLTLVVLTSCAPAMQPTTPVEAPAATEAPAAEVTEAPQPTQPVATPIPTIEKRVIELEWPARLRLGESDVLRLALVPSEDGYTARAEFEEHPLATQDIQIKHPSGYTLYGIARLHGVGFEIAPSGDQRRLVPPGEAVTWRWSLAARQAGQQRISVELDLRWEPDPASPGPVGESLAFGRSLEVEVVSFMGLTRFQALGLGMFSLLLGGGLGAVVLLVRRPQTAGRLQAASRPQAANTLQAVTPNRGLRLEHTPQIHLADEEQNLIQALFARYDRLILENEFFSGYSGARTFLARPLYADGRGDAATIVKMSSRSAVLQEFHNYETFVKDRLPPVTARIQRAPVTTTHSRLAALQYTFIAEPGRLPRSLRQTLLEQPDPAPLRRLFETFGPNWWLQRQPYTFRLEQEYDRLLPPHWVLKPAPERNARRVIGEEGQTGFSIGEIVHLGDFPQRELRAAGDSWSLSTQPGNGAIPLRVRWLSPQPPKPGTLAVVVASRMGLLHDWTKDFERFGLPDPLDRLEGWLQTTLQGARSTIHGDLNLENILVGPGELVWLIDFAQTRDGHTLFDFAHLSAEIAAHVLALKAGSPRAFLQHLQQGDPLLEAIQQMSRRCLFDPANDQERRLAQAVTCLGALKFANLTPLARHCLYLMAASLASA
jgi:hypothetical protein